MTDAQTVESPGTVNLSTKLEPGTYDTNVGAGQPSFTEEKPAEEKAESLRDVLSDEMKKKPEKAEEKPEEPKKAEKPEKAEAKPKEEDAEPAKETAAEKPEGQPEASTATGQEETQAERRSSEGRRAEPPARFLPEAREQWANVPNRVKDEIHRVTQEYETQAKEYETASRVYSEVKQFDDMAKQSGTSLGKALGAYVQIEQALREDFGKGIAAVAQNMGKSPMEAVNAVLAAYGVTPQKFAEAVQRNPDQFRAQPQAPRDPAVQQIQQQLAQMNSRFEQQERAQQAQTLQAEVNRWAADKPDFKALEKPMSDLLELGAVDRVYGAGLSPMDKLNAAYRMAGGRGPTLSDAPSPAAETAAPPERPVNPDAGKKSVRGAPTDGVTPASDDSNVDLKEYLRREMRRMAS